MSSLDTQRIYAFGDFRLDARSRSLTRGSGERVALTGKALDTLVYLVEHAGTLVTRSALMKELWPSTVVEENSLTQAISAVRRALGDQDDQRFIATISGRGYQFVGDVRTMAAHRGAATSPVDDAPGTSEERDAKQARAPATASEQRMHATGTGVPGLGTLVVIVIALVALAGGLYVAGRSHEPAAKSTNARLPAAGALPNSVAVLPFRNLSPNADDAYFAAGLHEQVLDKLAKIRTLTVIARTSVMGYADAARPLSEIATELHVGSVLEGSASREGDRVRVSVQLVGAATDAVLWSEVYDGSLSDVFAIQADIAARIAAALESELSPAERRDIERAPTESLEAYSLYLRALAQFREGGGIGPGMPNTTRGALQSYLDQAIALDPQFAAAYAWKAYLYVDSLFADPVPENEWASRREEWMGLVAANLERAIAHDPAPAMAYVARARLGFYTWRLADAGADLERAHQLSPNDSQVLQQMALDACLLGEFARGVELARRALEIDPKNPGSYAPLEVGLQALGEDAAAAATARAMIATAPRAAVGYLLLARAEAARGNRAKAFDALRLTEPLVQDNVSAAADVAASYRSVGAVTDALRVLDVYRRLSEGLHVSPAVRAAAFLAGDDRERALEQARAALEARQLGMDPFRAMLIARNLWSLPALEEPEWIEIRKALATSD